MRYAGNIVSIVLTVSVFGLCVSSAYAANVVWDGGGGGDTNWSTAANWSDDSVPGVSDVAIFDGTSDNNSTVDSSFTTTIGGIRIGPNYDGTVTLAKPLGVSGAVVISGGTLDVSGSNYDLEVEGDFIVFGNGDFTSRSGTLHLAGTGTNLTLSGSTAFHTIALSGSILSNTADDPNLLAYWKFDEGTGDPADSSGNGYTSTLENEDGNEWVTDVPTVQFTNPYSLDFDAGNDYVDTGIVSNEFTSPVSFSVWIKSDDAGSIGNDFVAQRFITQARTGGNTRIAFGINRDSLAIFMHDGNADIYEGATDLTADTWYHAAFRYNGSTVYVYLDGDEQINQSYTGMTAPSGSDNVILSGNGSNYEFDGTMDDFRIYDRFLSVAEIEKLASGQIGFYGGNGSGQYTLGSSLSVKGDFLNYNGFVDASSNDHSITLSGSWLNYGTFTPQNGSVVFDGTSQTLSGSTMFYNLTKTVAAADTLYFDWNGAVQSVSGALTLQGTDSNLLSLRSTSATSSGRLLLDSVTGTQSLQYLDVARIDSSGGASMNASDGTSTDSGNNTNWNFPTPLSGVYVWDGGGGDNNWSTANNWDQNSVPGVTDIAVFNGISDNNSTVDSSFTTTIGGIRMGPNYDGTITLAHPLGVSGSVVISGGTLDVSGSNYDLEVTGDFRVFGAGDFTARSGTLFLGDTDTNSTLSTTASLNNLTLDDGSLLGYWKLDETATGATIYDSSGNGNNGTMGFTATISNDSFENGSGVDADNWTEGTNADRVSDKAHTGTYSMKYVTPTTGQATSQGSITLSAIGTYTIGGWVWNELTAGGAYIDVNDIAGDCHANSTQGLGEWEYVSCDFTTTSTNQSVTMRLVTDGNGSNTGNVWFDDVAIYTHPYPYPGRIDGALDFNGVNDSLAMGTFDEVATSATFTAWINLDTLGICEPIVFSRGTVTTGMNVACNGTTLGYHWNDDSNTWGWYSGPSLSTGTWSFAAIAVEPTKATAYLDGSSAVNAIAHSSTTLDNLILGYDSCCGGRYLDGRIDDARIYNRALSLSELDSLATGNLATGSGYYTLGAALDVNGNFSNVTGSLDVSGSNYAMTVGGHWKNHGDFVPQNGTVTLDGTYQTISGSTLFYNLTKSTASADTLTIQDNNILYISGALTLNGADSNLLALRSATGSSAFYINLDAEAGTQSLSYVDTKDSNAGKGDTIVCLTDSSGCVDSGNNVNWQFSPTISVVGTVYTDEGVTNIGAGKTIALSVNGAAAADTDETDSNGFYSVSTEMNKGDVLTLYLDDETEDAVTVTISSGSMMTGVNLYQNRLILKNETGGVITNTHVAISDDNADSDITTLLRSASTSQIVVHPEYELMMWSGTTFTPGGNIVADDLDVNGTLTMASNTLTLSGSLSAQGGTLTTSGETYLYGTGSQTLETAGNSLENLTIEQNSLEEGLVGWWRFDNNGNDSSPYGHTAVGQNTPGYSTTTSDRIQFANSYSANLNGSNEYFIVTTTSTLNFRNDFTTSAWVKFTGVNRGIFDKDFNSNNGFYNFIGGGGHIALTVRTADGDFDKYSNTSFNDDVWHHFASTYDGANIQIYRDGVPDGSLAATGTLDDHSGDNLDIGRINTGFTNDYYSGLLDDARIYNRALNGDEILRLSQGYISGLYNQSLYTLGSALDVDGDFKLLHGGLDTSASDYSITVGGDWINATGTGFVAQESTVTLDGTSQLLSGSTIFYNLTKTVASADTLTFQTADTFAISGALTLNGADSNLLSIRSSADGSVHYLNLDAEAGTQSISYLNVQDSNASKGDTLTCFTATEGCVNSGNNTNWTFTPTVAVVGTVYTDEGVTDIGASKTVALSVNGAAAADTDETDSNGFYSVSTEMSKGDVLTLYLDDETEDAVTVTISSGSMMTGVNLYQNRLILKSETGSIITTTHLQTADDNADSDITGLYSFSSNDLTVEADTELYVWSDTQFVAGGKVSGHDLDVPGKISMGNNSLVLSGSLVATGSFLTSTGVILNSSQSNETLSVASGSVQDLTLNSLENDLIAWWQLDEESGTTAPDSSGNGNTITFSNTEDLDWREGRPNLRYFNNRSFRFNSDNESGNAGGNIDLANNSFTIAFWDRPIESGTERWAIGQGTSTQHEGLHIGYNSTNVFRCAFWSNDLVTTDTYTDLAWHHWACTYDASNNSRVLYRDGEYVTSDTASADYQGTGDFYIGRRPQTSDSRFGLIDEIRVYSRSLDFDEVAKLADGYERIGGATYTLGAALDIDGTLLIKGNTLDASVANNAVTIGGNFYNEGTFTPRSGTVTLDGTSQTLSGSTTFYNLTKLTATTDTLTFYRGDEFAISGALSLYGAVSNLLSLRSSTDGSVYYLNVDAEAGTQNLSYLDVQDSNASSGATLICLTAAEGCVNSGNNTNWTFAFTLALVGTVYTDEGVTDIGASKTVALSVNGAAAADTDETDSNGFYSVSTEMNKGDVLTLYLDDETEDAVTVTISSGSMMTGVNLYQNRLILKNETGGIITTTHLQTSDDNADADITGLYSFSSNDLSVQKNTELLVWSDSTFIPSGKIQGHDIDVPGTITLGTNSLVLSGSLIASGSLTTSTGVILNGLSDSTAPETISVNGTLNDVRLDTGLVGYWKLDEGTGTVAKDSSPYGNHGTLQNGDADEWTTTTPSTYFHNPYSVDLDGSNDYFSFGSGIWNSTGPVTYTFWNYIVSVGNTNGTGGSGNHQAADRMQTHAPWSDGNIYWDYGDVNGNGRISTSYSGYTGKWTHVALTSYGDANQGMAIYLDGSEANSTTVSDGPSGDITWEIGRFVGGANLYHDGMIDDMRLYNRVLSESEIEQLASGYVSTGSGYYTLGSNLMLNGDLLNYSSTVDVSVSNYSITLSGNWLNMGDFLSQNGTVTLDGTNQAFSGSTMFYNLSKTVSSADTLSFDSTAAQYVSGALILRGAASNLLSIRSTSATQSGSIALDAESGSQTLEYLDVASNDARGGATLNCSTACVDSGNTQNWDFTEATGGNNYFQFFDF